MTTTRATFRLKIALALALANALAADKILLSLPSLTWLVQKPLATFVYKTVWQGVKNKWSVTSSERSSLCQDYIYPAAFGNTMTWLLLLPLLLLLVLELLLLWLLLWYLDNGLAGALALALAWLTGWLEAARKCQQIIARTTRQELDKREGSVAVLGQRAAAATSSSVSVPK